MKYQNVKPEVDMLYVFSLTEFFLIFIIIVAIAIFFAWLEQKQKDELW